MSATSPPADRSASARKLLAWVLFALLALAAASRIVPRARVLHEQLDLATNQGDFTVYYCAGVAYRQGKDPYLERITPLALTSPPWALPALARLSDQELEPARHTWLRINEGVAVALLAVVFLAFFRRPAAGALDVGLFLAVALFGFGETLFVALRTGNAALIQQLVLWCAILVLVRTRSTPVFGGLVLVASLFKLFPIVFAVLAWLVDPRRRSAWIAAGAVAALVALLGVSWASDPALFASYLSVLEPLRGGGRANPSSWNLLLDGLGRNAGGWIAVALWTGGVLALTYATWRRARERMEPQDVVALVCLAFALASPRMKDYAFLLVLGPAAWVVCRRAFRSPFGKLALTVALCVEPFAYGALLQAAAVHAILVARFWRRAPEPALVR